ncbi:MAG: hypothetical protein KKF77_06100 [Proteobacteria bacterium]|nr:hypothetical protein [Pseudomonadota bacterium]
MPIAQRSMNEETRDIMSLFVLALLCYLDKILLGPYAVIDFYDTLEVHFSHFLAMARLWSEYGAFSWYPFLAGGAPSFVGQHPPYHPGVVFSMVLPIWLLALLWNIAQMFLAGYGMYRFLRILPRISRQVSLVMAALFSLTWVSGNVHMVMPYAFPAVFVWTVDLCRSDLGRLKRLGSALLILLVSLFSYPVLTLPHFPVIHLALVLFMGRHLPNFRRQVLGVFLVWTGYVLLFVPSIVSLFLYIPFAQRDWDFRYPGLGAALRDFWHWFAGRLGDQSMLGLVLLALPLFNRKRLRVCLVMLLAVLLISSAFNSDLKSVFAGSFLLKMDLFMFATTTGILSFLIAALAVETYASESRSFAWWHVLIILAVLPLFGAAHKVLGYVFPLGAGIATIMLLRRSMDKPPQRTLTLALTALLICLAGVGMIVRQQFMTSGLFVPYAKGYLGHPALTELARKTDKHPFRVACIDVHPGVIQSYGLDTVGGKSPLFNKYYKEFVLEIVRPQLPTQKLVTEFNDLWRQLYLSRNKIDHDQHGITIPALKPRTAADLNWRLLEVMNVTHVVAAEPVAGLEQFARSVVVSPGLDQEAPWLSKLGLAKMHSLPLWIYTLATPQARAYLAHPVVLEERQQVLSALGSASAPTLRSEVFLAREDLPEEFRMSSGKDSPGDVRITSWSPDRIVLEGKANGPGVLVVSNNYDPRWQAESEGEKLHVFRANHAFQGISIDRAGPFNIELTFKSPLIWWLNLASLAGIVLMLSAVLFRQTSSPQPATLLAAPSQQLALSWRRCLTIGGCSGAVWALSFALFVMSRNKGPQAETYGYAIWSITCIGIVISLWSRRISRLL